MRPKKNYAIMELNVPKRVTLPNGRTFVARYTKRSIATKYSYEKDLHSKGCAKG